MFTTLNTILNTLKIDHLHHHYNDASISYYYGARWLAHASHPLEPNYIYIGYASMLPDELPGSDTGIIISNDTGRDFSSCTCDLVELPKHCNPAELCLQIKEEIFHSCEISSISQQIIERIIRSPTIKEIVDLTASMLENPVFINFHFSGRQFFHSAVPHCEDEINILEDMKRHTPSSEIMERVNAIWNSPNAAISEDGMVFHGKRRIQAPISKGVKGGPKIGILTVFEVNRPFTIRDQAFVSIIAYLFSIRAKEPGFDKQLLGYRYEQKLQDLLSGSSIPKDMNWSHALFGSEFHNFSLALTDTKNLMPSQIEDLKYFLLQNTFFGTVLMRGSYLILIVNRKEEQATCHHSILDRAAGRYQLSFGVSDDFDDIRKLKKYYTQAKRIRELNANQEQETGIFLFSQYRFPLLIHDISSLESPDLFANDAFDRLLTHDEDKNTDYCKTLMTYIRCGMNKDMTRIQLNIHRNTLTYRLDKIEEILGRSLYDGEFLLCLYFSSLIHESQKTDSTSQTG